MAVFLVLGESRPDLESAVSTRFANGQSLKVAPGQWLVAGNFTPQGASDYLGASGGAYGRVMISLVTSYYGWHERNIWDWIVLKSSSNG